MGLKKNVPSSSCSSSSSSIECSSKFKMTLVVGRVRFFKWEILNFSRVNAQCIFSDYFDLGGYRFRFRLFPTVQETSRRKYLSLQLETDEADPHKYSCFIRSKITVVNHVFASDSLVKYIFHRFASDRQVKRYDDFVPLDDPPGRKCEFLINGTGLHISGDIISLMEAKFEFFDVSELDQFGWTIQNYSFFEEIVRVGMIESDPFLIGGCKYCMRVGALRDMNQEYMSIFLEPLVKTNEKDEADKHAWIVADVIVKSPNLRGKKITRSAHGRTGRWLLLVEMSEFESSINDLQGFVPEANILALRLEFKALEERHTVHRNMANSKTIWNFGEGSKATSSTAETARTFLHFSWEILKFSRIEKLMYRPDVGLEEIRSKRIRLTTDTGVIMVIYPGGDSTKKSHLGMFLTPDTVNAGVQLNMLVHYRLAAVNQKDPQKTVKMEEIERFERSIDEILYGFPELIPTSTFYKYAAAGFLVGDTTRFDAYIHVLKETYKMEKNCLTWEVDNFLAWEGIRGARPVPSSCFLVNECLLRIEVSVSDDGMVYGTLSSKPGKIYDLLFQIGVMDRHKPNDHRTWETLIYSTDKKKFCRMGTLSDILKEDAGYIVDDKVVFFCHVRYCSSRRI